MDSEPTPVGQQELSDTLHRFNNESIIAQAVGKPWSFDDMAAALLAQFTILHSRTEGN